MLAIFKKELYHLLGSFMGYLLALVFLLLSVLLTWFFQGNIWQGGYAEFDVFFETTPILFMFILPALAMRAFSEEIRQGTLEKLLTLPLSVWDLVWGKYLAMLFFLIFMLLPTLLYAWTLSTFAPIDWGAFCSAWLGLLLVGACFLAIGIFVSACTANQMIAFLLAFFLSIWFWLGLDNLGSFLPEWQNVLNALSLQSHYKSIARGVLNSGDVLFFVLFTFCFTQITGYMLKKH